MNITPELIVTGAGILLAVIFDFVPKAKAWFETKSVEEKRLANAALLLAVAVGIFGFNCLGWASGLGIPAVACDQPGALSMVQLFILGLGMNYGTHAVSRFVTKSVSARA